MLARLAQGTQLSDQGLSLLLPGLEVGLEGGQGIGVVGQGDQGLV